MSGVYRRGLACLFDIHRCGAAFVFASAVLFAVFAASGAAHAAAGDIYLDVRDELGADLAGTTLSYYCTGGSAQVCADDGGCDLLSGGNPDIMVTPLGAASCDPGDTIYATLSTAGYANTIATGFATYTATVQNDSIVGLKFSLRVMVGDELGNALSSAPVSTVTLGGAAAVKASSGSLYFTATSSGALAASKSGFLDLSLAANTQLNSVNVTSASQTLVILSGGTPCSAGSTVTAGSSTTCAGLKYSVLLSVKDELGNAVPGVAVTDFTIGGFYASKVSSNNLYFETSSAGALAGGHSGFVNLSAASDTQIASIVPSTSTQNMITLKGIVPCSVGGTIVAGSPVTCSGLQYGVKVSTVQDELGNGFTLSASDTFNMYTNGTCTATATYIAGPTFSGTSWYAAVPAGTVYAKYYRPGYVEKCNSTPATVSQAGPVASPSFTSGPGTGLKYGIKIVVKDELGSTVSGLGLTEITVGGIYAAQVSGNSLYYDVTSAGGVYGTRTGYVLINLAGDTQLASVTPGVTAQTLVGLMGTTPCSSGGSISAGSTVTCSGLLYGIKVAVADELGMAISGVAVSEVKVGGNNAAAATGSYLYYNSGSGVLTSSKTGYVNVDGAVDTQLASVIAGSASQTVVNLTGATACATGGSISSGATVSCSGLKYAVKVDASSELTVPLSGLTNTDIKINGSNAAAVSGNSLYYSIAAAGPITGGQAGFININSVADTQLASISPGVTAQTHVTLYGTYPCMSGSSVAAGSTAVCTGLKYAAKVVVYDTAGALITPMSMTDISIGGTYATQTSSNELYYILTSGGAMAGGHTGYASISVATDTQLALVNVGTSTQTVVTLSGTAVCNSGASITAGTGTTCLGLHIPPLVTDMQTGDDTWYATGTGAIYYAQADSYAGAFLSTVEYSAWTAPGMNTGTGTQVIGWTDIGVDPGSTLFSWPWGPAYAPLAEGFNYISVRAVDTLGFVSNIATDAFYVKKDTTLPVVTDNQAGDMTWYSSDPGMIFNVDFADTLSGLSSAEYSAWTGPGMTGTNTLSWASINVIPGSAAETSDWAVSFNSLATGVNYISVRTTDVAGNVSDVATDVFFVKVDTATPTVTDNQAGDSTFRNTDPGAIYDVDFGDPVGGSGLSYAQYTVYDAAAMGGSMVQDWTNLATSINADTFTTNWAVNFATLPENISYVSVRAYDTAGNVSDVATDVFFVSKDTQPPTGAFISYTSPYVTSLSVPVSFSAGSDTNGVPNWWIYRRTSVLDTGRCNSYGAWGQVASAPASLTDTSVTAGNCYQYRLNIADGLGNATSTCSDSNLCATPLDAKVSATAGALACTSGDTSQNGYINIVDAGVLKSNYSKTGSLVCSMDSDLNGDNQVDATDVSLLAASYLSYSGTGTPETPNGSSAASLTLSPSPAYLLMGTPMNIDVVMTPGSALVDGVDVHLDFATSTLSLTNMTVYPPSGFTQMAATSSNSAGTAGFSLFNATGTKTGAAVTIARLTFTVVTAATTTVSFAKTASTNRYTGVLDNGYFRSVTTSNLTLIADTGLPMVIDNQAGDDTWRTADPGAVYDVDFMDTGGTSLNNVMYTAWTGPGQTGTQTVGWTNIAAGIGTNTYTANWGVKFASLTEGINYISAKAFDAVGNMSPVQADVFYVKKDTEGPVFGGLQSATVPSGICGRVDLAWNAAADAQGNGPETYAVYYATKSGTQNYTTPATTTSATSVAMTGLTDGQMLYFVVRAVDSLGNQDKNTTEISATPANTALPTVTDNQTGDDTWRTTDPGAIYDVDFTDPGCSTLSYFKYASYGSPGMAGPVLVNWATGVQGINSSSYTTNWGVDFFKLPDGVNYIAVYAGKSNGVVSAATEVFYIKKDVTAPSAPGTVNDGTGADAAYATTTGQLSANWSAGSDPHSGIAEYLYSIGTTAGASNTVPWTSAGTSTTVTKTGLTLTEGQTYYVSVAAMNAAGLYSGVTTSNGMQASLTGPSSTIVNPMASSSVNALTVITGTATDTGGSGLLKVEISIKRNSDNLYWSAGGWISSETWIIAGGTTSWSASGGLPSWSNGVSYTVKSRATDNAGHVETPGTGATFTFDSTAPAVSITSPLTGAKLNSKTVNAAGTCEAGATVSVNGVAATVTTTSWTATVTAVEGANTITAVATDAAGNTAQTSVSVGVDATLPVAQISSPSSSASVKGSISISGTAYDANFSGYTLEYGTGTSPLTWKQFGSGSAAVSSSVLGTVDMSALQGAYTIRLIVTDSYGNSTSASVQVTVSGNPVSRTVEVSASEWSIVSVPMTPDDATMADILNPEKYKVYKWDPEAATDTVTGKYRKPATLVAGDAIWIKAVAGASSLVLTGTPADTTKTYQVTLGNGWNQVGTPFNWAMTWSKVLVKQGGSTYTLDQAVSMNLIESTPFDYNMAGWSQVTANPDPTLQPGRGYFLYAPSSGVSLLFDPGSENSKGIARVVRTDNGFSLKLSARTARVRDLDNIISVVSGASDMRDGSDLREPPAGMDKYISLYFPHMDWGGDAGKYTNDARAAAGTDPGCAAPAGSKACKNFNFTVETNDTGTVTLSWGSFDTAKYSAKLKDLTTGSEVDMSQSTEYQFTGQQRNFRVAVTHKGGAVKKVTRRLSKGWNLVSIPVEPDVTDAVKQLGAGSPLKVYQYYDGRFTSAVGGGVDLQAGIGYWIFADAEMDLTVEGSEVTPSSPVVTPLKKGWNLIGDPYETPITWGDNIKVTCGGGKTTLGEAVSAGKLAGTLFKPDGGGGYERRHPGDTLQPWEGLLLKAGEECSLEFGN